MVVSNEIRTITLNGNHQTLLGEEVKVNQVAPRFQVVDLNMKPFHFTGTGGKVTIISSVSSLDTSVCDVETRRFNQEAAKLGDQVDILTISMDLPFAQRRWCGAAGIDKVKVLSDYQHASFGNAFGILIKESKLLARCIFIVDKDNIVKYVQLVPEIGQEPDYPAVIEAVHTLL